MVNDQIAAPKEHISDSAKLSAAAHQAAQIPAQDDVMAQSAAMAARGLLPALELSGKDTKESPASFFAKMGELSGGLMRNLEDINTSLLRTFQPIDYFYYGAQSIFDAIDQDKNGLISRNELSKALDDPRFKGPSAVILATLYELVSGSVDSAIQAKKQEPYQNGISRDDIFKLASNPFNVLSLIDSMSDAAQNSKGGNVLFGSKGIRPDDVVQEHLGDCVFASSMASLAEMRPDIVRKMITDNGNGTYSVHTPVADVTVSGPTEAERALASRGGNGIWPLILEKAFAKYQSDMLHSEGTTPGKSSLPGLWYGVYERDALNFLTGKGFFFQDLVSIRGDERAPERIAGLIRSKLALGSSIIAGIDLNKSGHSLDGFPAWHAYSVLGFDPRGKDGGTITLRNPWGVGFGTPAGQWQISMKQFVKNFDVIHYTGI